MKNIDILRKFFSRFPKKLTLFWLAVIGVLSGFLLYAIQTNNRIMVMVLAVVYIVFGLYVTARINRNNLWLVKLWRNAPPEITTWGKIWRTVVLVGFWVFIIWYGLKYGFGSDTYY